MIGQLHFIYVFPQRQFNLLFPFVSLWTKDDCPFVSSLPISLSLSVFLFVFVHPCVFYILHNSFG